MSIVFFVTKCLPYVMVSLLNYVRPVVPSSFFFLLG